jgi:hypothetical protein
VTGTRKSLPAFTTNVKLGYRIAPHWELGLDVLNLFNSKSSDIAEIGARRAPAPKAWRETTATASTAASCTRWSPARSGCHGVRACEMPGTR